MNFFAPDKIPCTHCGMEEKRHQIRHDFRRRGDDKVKVGYTVTLSLCMGYVPKQNERSNRDSTYSGPEKRNLYPLPKPELLLEFLAKLTPPSQTPREPLAR